VSTDFSLFSQQAHIEKIEHALAEILLADAELHEFFDGRIWVTPEPFTYPEGPLPLLTVSAVSQAGDFRTSCETEKQVPVALGGFYDELREKVDSSERTVKSLIEKIETVIANNWRLENTNVSQQALVDRVFQFEAVPFPPITSSDEEADAVFNIQMIVTYEYLANLQTGLKA
jgi:hypothetical protein